MASLTMVKIEDREFEGICGACRRENLRWIVTLSDGTTVGLECAKKAIGFRPAPTAYNWITHFRIVDERVRYGDHEVLWQHKTGSQTRLTVNGVLMTVGGARKDWERTR